VGGISNDLHVHFDPQYPLKISQDINWKEVNSKIDLINVQIFAVVSSEGCVDLALPLIQSGIQNIDASATRDVFMARFLPAVVDGKPVSASIVIPIHFTRKR